MTQETVDRLVEKAVLKERERCAKIAEHWGGAPPSRFGRRALLAAFIRSGQTTTVQE